VHDLSYSGPGIALYSWPYHCVFSADGTQLAAHCETLSATGIRIWNVSSGTIVKTLGITGRSFAFSSDKSELYIGGMNGTITIRDIAADTTVFEWTAHGFNNDVTLMHTVQNGTQLVSASYGSAEFLQIWNLGTIVSQRNISGYNYEFYSISADESLVSAGPYVRNMNSGNLVRTFSGGVTGQTCIMFNNTQVIEKKYDGTLTIYNISSSAPVWSKTMPRANVYTFPAIAASPNQNLFASASSEENKIDLWTMKYAWRVF
jgi:WD40 repeat protein